MGSTFKEKKLLLEEQILFFKSWSLREAKLVMFHPWQLCPFTLTLLHSERPKFNCIQFWPFWVCVYSDSRNDVPRVAQRYRIIAAHTLRRASVLVVFVVFCMHMHSFAGLIRRTPPPTFSDTAITDRHSDTTNLLLRAHWVRISWSIGSGKLLGRFFWFSRPGYPHPGHITLKTPVLVGSPKLSNVEPG